ncbi:DUF6191 domain-containing protein [Streptomyces sp. NPDC056061]|uniref:DUF6191 domain-containing protein n=1 Tax=Streptomyces sp. NPDC056061 TaxID=3345700 RepID=UPI0035DC5CD2
MRLVFNFFEEIFAPGRRHAAEERKRLELSRVDLGVGDPGRGPIDLASGKVVVRAPGADGAPRAEHETEPQDGTDEQAGPVPGNGTDAIPTADPEPAPCTLADGPAGEPRADVPRPPGTGRDVRP